MPFPPAITLHVVLTSMLAFTYQILPVTKVIFSPPKKQQEMQCVPRSYVYAYKVFLSKKMTFLIFSFYFYWHVCMM